MLSASDRNSRARAVCIEMRVPPRGFFAFLTLFCAVATSALSQAREGSVRISVIDATGHPIAASVRVTGQGDVFAKDLSTGDLGTLTVDNLPYGIYRIQVQKPGFVTTDQSVEIKGSRAVRVAIQLRIAAPTESVTVNTPDTLLAVDQPGSVQMLGTNAIHDRLGSLPGRSLEDVINSQPGWLYEGSAVLHPRGSEYQTQFVIDGVPLTDNRSPAFGPELEADEVDSMTIYTAGIPAEYGRKMGGVIEVDTARDAQPGVHGQVVLDGGSFATAGLAADLQYARSKDAFAGTGAASRTDHYLNPVVPQNFTNSGRARNVGLRYERTPSANNKFSVSLRRESSRFNIPNELIQQAAGQLQTAGNAETMGVLAFDRTITDHASAAAHAMLRSKTSTFGSNPQSTPVVLFQTNGFREAYFNGSATLDRGPNEWKAGLDSDNTFLREAMSYSITEPSRFDPTTPASFAFADDRPDLEQSAYLQDTIHLRRMTIAAGLRWDHYQLLVNRSSLQPRLAASYYLPGGGLLLHGSYDRVYQTPESENILLSSSTQIEALNPGDFLRLPVEPSTGNYFEVGVSKDFAHRLRLDSNYFRRSFSNFADDNQLQNTTVAFPISFHKAVIYGMEGKLDIPAWHKLSGFASYSWQVGKVWFPITGGLFLGADAADVAANLSGHFPNSQDQRNTLRARARYQTAPRIWFAAGVAYDSGLPFEFDGTPETALAQYGPSVIARLNFDRGRILPATLLNASAGATLHHSDRFTTTLQADGENLGDTLDVLDFAGLFSGNAIGPPRSFLLRLTTNF